MRGPAHHRVPVTTTTLTPDILALEVRAALTDAYLSRSDARRVLRAVLPLVAADLHDSGLPGAHVCARRVLGLAGTEEQR